MTTRFVVCVKNDLDVLDWAGCRITYWLAANGISTRGQVCDRLEYKLNSVVK